MTIPAHALYFTVYEGTKRRLQPDLDLDEKSWWVHFCSGFLADCIGLSIWLPMDLVKQRLQVQRNDVFVKYKNSFQAFTRIYSQEGIFGLYRGGSVAALSMYGALYFSLYEYWKWNVSKYLNIPIDDLTMANQLLGGFVSGGTAAALTCPIDVIKTQMQVYSLRNGGFRSPISTAKDMFQTGGTKIFIAGIFPRIIWIGGGTSITLGVYEQLKKIFK